MSTPEETRTGAQTADSTAAADAYAEREARLAADEAQLAAGAHPGHDEQTQT